MYLSIRWHAHDNIPPQGNRLKANEAEWSVTIPYEFVGSHDVLSEATTSPRRDVPSQGRPAEAIPHQR